MAARFNNNNLIGAIVKDDDHLVSHKTIAVYRIVGLVGMVS